MYAVIGRCQCKILWRMDDCESRIKDGGLRMNGMAIEYWGSGFSFIANHEFFIFDGDLVAFWDHGPEVDHV